VKGRDDITEGGRGKRERDCRHVHHLGGKGEKKEGNPFLLFKGERKRGAIPRKK